MALSGLHACATHTQTRNDDNVYITRQSQTRHSIRTPLALDNTEHRDHTHTMTLDITNDVGLEETEDDGQDVSGHVIDNTNTTLFERLEAR